MYEDLTYEQLLRRMLAFVTEHNRNMDTREGSVVWYGQAPAATELINMYIALDTILQETFADTASRPYLIKRAKERGVEPKAASKAIVQGAFTPSSLELAPGTRFSVNNMYYAVTKKRDDGTYEMQCEIAGAEGNNVYGTLLPVGYIPGLETASIIEVLTPGEDEEETESFRRRYFESLKGQAFGGNVMDYKEKVKALDGVGGVKVYRMWNENLRPADMVPSQSVREWLAETAFPEAVEPWITTVAKAAGDGLFTVGGTVRLVIIPSTFTKPSQKLVDDVQQAVDPVDGHGEGLGSAPIGHFVTVRGVEVAEVDISTEIIYASGWDWEKLQPYAEEAIDNYFLDLAKSWAEEEEPLVVRISQIENKLLNLKGVLDIGGTVINGEKGNLVLDRDSIPVRRAFYG